MWDLSITTGVVPTAALLLGAVAFGILLVHRTPGWWTRRVPAAAAGGLLLTLCVALLTRGVDGNIGPVVTVALIWTAVVLVGSGLAILRRGRRSTRALAFTMVATTVVCGAVQVDSALGEYPTVASMFGDPLPDQVGAGPALTDTPELAAARGELPLTQSWHPPADLPAAGQVVEVSIPGTVSGFSAGAAWIYLPPAYATRPRAELPVLILMAGDPGEPRDWFDEGGVAATMDAYAAAHGGLAPVVVVPDWLGTTGDNPLCVDSAAAGDDWTYLTVDVRNWVLDSLQVDPDPRGWAVGGLSAGGTCALQMATRDPADYPTVLAFSAQAHPLLEDGEDTVETLFGGDQNAYDAIDPMAILTSTRFPAGAGFFAAGEDDEIYGPQTRTVYAAAEAAGMDVQYAALPGGHEFGVWSAALALAAPWLGSRLRITP